MAATAAERPVLANSGPEAGGCGSTAPHTQPWRVGFALLILLAVLPLVAHGCHGDDGDHEPLAPPPRPAPSER